MIKVRYRYTSLFIFFYLIVLHCSKDSQWKIYTTANTPLTIDRIRQIVLENDKLSWVGTFGGGLYRVGDDTWQRVGAPYKGDYVLSLRKDNRGGLWVGTSGNGAFYYYKNEWNHFSEADGLAGNNVWDIFLEDEETYWFCSRYRGACRMQKDSVYCFDIEKGLPDRQVTLAQRDSSGRIWFGTVRGGLAGYKNGQFTYLNTRNGLSGNYIRALVCDSVPRWVGSWDGGVDYYTGKAWEHVSEIRKPVVFLGYDMNNTLWVGTWGHGVYYKRDTMWENLCIENSGLPNDYVIDIKFAQNGAVYFATSKGVAVFSP